MSAEEWTLSRLKDNPVDALGCIHALEAEVARLKDSDYDVLDEYAQTMKDRAEGAEAKLAEAVRLLEVSRSWVKTPSGDGYEVDSIWFIERERLLASIDNDPAKHNHVAPLKSRQPPEVTRPPAQESPVGLGASRDPGTGSGTRPGDSPSGVSVLLLCEEDGLWEPLATVRAHEEWADDATPDDMLRAHGVPVGPPRKPTHRPSAELDECGEGR